MSLTRTHYPDFDPICLCSYSLYLCCKLSRDATNTNFKVFDVTHWSLNPGSTTLDKIKILGITIPTNGNTEDLIRYNFVEKKEKIKSIVCVWSKRNPTYGKVTIIKSSIIPQLTYQLSVLPNPGHS